MKKLKITAVISGILTLLQLFPVIMPVILLGRLWLSEPNASAIGIIGGADGPTAVYVSGIFPTLVVIARYAFFAVCALTFIISIALLIRKKNKNNG